MVNLGKHSLPCTALHDFAYFLRHTVQTCAGYYAKTGNIALRDAREKLYLT